MFREACVGILKSIQEAGVGRSCEELNVGAPSTPLVGGEGPCSPWLCAHRLLCSAHVYITCLFSDCFLVHLGTESCYVPRSALNSLNCPGRPWTHIDPPASAS